MPRRLRSRRVLLWRAPPVLLLPVDVLHNVLGRLSFSQALDCRLVCRLFRNVISCPTVLAGFPLLRLLGLGYPRAATPYASLYTFGRHWLCFPLTYLPFTASPSLLYLWVDNAVAKSLVLCNPFARPYRFLPPLPLGFAWPFCFPPRLPLGFAWSGHGIFLPDPNGSVLILTALAYAPGADQWLKFSLKLKLPSKPWSPILMGGTIYTLCDVGTHSRIEWKLFSCRFPLEFGRWAPIEGHGWRAILESLKPRRRARRLRGWAPIEGHRWGDIFEILMCPCLLAGSGEGQILMIGELRTSSATSVIDAPCSTVLILRLDLVTLECDDAGTMPLEMYQSFNGGTLRVFGGDGRVWFLGESVWGKLAMWEEAIDAWRWVDGVPGHNEGAYRGFVLNAGFTAMP